MIDYDARRAAVLRRERREDRRFHIIMGATCGLFVLFLVAVAWLIVATEPQRRAAYLADCQTRGFTVQQCAFLYSERLRQDQTVPLPLLSVRPHSPSPLAAGEFGPF